MRNRAKLITFIIITFISAFTYKTSAQCTIENIVPLNSTANGIIGQSFTACSDGILSEISVLPNSVITNVELRIYEGSGNSGTLLGTISGISLSIPANNTDWQTIDVSSANISVVDGASGRFWRQ